MRSDVRELVTHGLRRQKGIRRSPLAGSSGRGQQTQAARALMPGPSGTLPPHQRQPTPPHPSSCPMYSGPSIRSRPVPKGYRSVQNWGESTSYQPTGPGCCWECIWHQTPLAPAHPATI